MKIAKFTLDGYFNYGNVLQSYALNKILGEFGDTVDTIWHTEGRDLQDALLFRKWTFLDSIRFLFNRNNFRNKIEDEKNQWELIRRTYIKSFCDRFLNIRYDLTLADVVNKYDYFVVGSDQVWNPAWAQYDMAFLQFAPKSRRIAYAASIAAPTIPKEKECVFTKGILDFEHVSVREEDGARVVKELTGKEVPVMPDPTMLLGADEWLRIARRPSWLLDDEKILVTYFLCDPPLYVEEIANAFSLKIINILDPKVFNHYIICPEEWLYLIHKASLVITDSFHGTVFSIIFHTPFIVCDCDGNEVDKNMSSRIDTLLKRFSFENRRNKIIGKNNVGDIFNISFTHVDLILVKEKKRANCFLLKAFEN